MKIILTIVILFTVVGLLGYLVKDSENPPRVTNSQKINIAGNKLDLSRKGLVQVPTYVFDQVHLDELDLSNNNIGESLQAEIRRLQELKVLDLSNNRFTGVPAEIGQLKNLEILDLSNNLITGLPYELGNLSKLKLLDISGNNYSKQDIEKIQQALPSSTVIKTK